MSRSTRFDVDRLPMALGAARPQHKSLKRLRFEQLEARRMLAYLTPTLDLAWSQSTADAQYQYFPDDPVESLTDAYFATEPWDENDFAEFYYYSQSGPQDPQAQLDAFSEADAGATGRVMLTPKESKSGRYAGFGYANVDIGWSFANVRTAEAQSVSEMAVTFLVVADANDPEGSAVNVRFTLSTYTEGIGATGYALESPGFSLSDAFASTDPLGESRVTQRTEIFQASPGEEITLSWHVSAQADVDSPSAAAQAAAYIRVGLEVVAPDLVVDDLTWDYDPDNAGGVLLSHSVYEAPLTRDAYVSLYWSSDATPAGILGGPLFAKLMPQGVFDYATESISPAQLGERPAEATHLLAIYDRVNAVAERDEQNNFRALSLKPDLYPHSLEWLDDQLGAILHYTIEFPQLAGLPQALEQRAQFELYWAQDDAPFGNPIFRTTTALTGGEYGPLVAIIPRGPAPDGATGLVALIDGENVIDEGDEANNVAPLRLPDLVGETWDWNVERDDDRSKRGLDFAYWVNDADSRDDVEVEFYWARGPEWESRILPAAGKRTLAGEGDEGYHGLFNEPARWGAPPPGTTHVLLVLDPANKIKESDEDNNVLARPLGSPSEILANSVYFEAIETKIVGYFNPNQGQSTVSEAEVALGVDHFNWVKFITSIPEHWAIVHVPNPTQATELDLPVLDPLDFIDNTNQVVVVDIDLGRGERMAYDPVDRHPFYYNERNEVRRFTSSYELQFSDEPQFPHDFLQEGEFVSFRIRLAGVSYDLDDVRLPVVRPVDWKSNTVYDAEENLEGGIFLRVTEDISLYAPLAGGVFDIEEVVELNADFNGDGQVDAVDLGIWSQGFGSTDDGTPESGDADASGSIDGRDFLVWQRQFGAIPEMPAAEALAPPEPNALFDEWEFARLAGVDEAFAMEDAPSAAATATADPATDMAATDMDGASVATRRIWPAVGTHPSDEEASPPRRAVRRSPWTILDAAAAQREWSLPVELRRPLGP